VAVAGAVGVAAIGDSVGMGDVAVGAARVGRVVASVVRRVLGRGEALRSTGSTLPHPTNMLTAMSNKQIFWREHSMKNLYAKLFDLLGQHSVDVDQTQ
jgi:hypothetical protein